MQLDRLASEMANWGREVERAFAFVGERLNEFGRETSICAHRSWCFCLREVERLAANAAHNCNCGCHQEAAAVATASPAPPPSAPCDEDGQRLVAVESLKESSAIQLHPIEPLLLPSDWLQIEVSSLEGLHHSTVLLRAYNGQFLGVKKLKLGTSLVAKPATLRGRGLLKVHLLGGNKLALQSMADIPEEPYLTATNHGKLLARATEIQEWEEFEAQFMEDGRVALRSCAHEQYVCCEDDGGSDDDVKCKSDDAAEREMFRMVRVVVTASRE